MLEFHVGELVKRIAHVVEGDRGELGAQVEQVHQVIAAEVNLLVAAEIDLHPHGGQLPLVLDQDFGVAAGKGKDLGPCLEQDPEGPVSPARQGPAT